MEFGFVLENNSGKKFISQGIVNNKTCLFPLIFISCLVVELLVHILIRFCQKYINRFLKDVYYYGVQV